MNRLWIVFALCILAAQLTIADEWLLIAVPEFQNATGKTLRISGFDMAAWMTSEFKKTKKFEPIDQDKLIAITKGATFSAGRFNQDVENRIKELPATYVLYGCIRTFEIENFILHDPWRGGEPQVPHIILEFSMRLVDLSGRRADQRLLVHGDVLGDRDQGFSGPPYDADDSDMDLPFQQASRKAMREAAKNLAENIQ